ncbi:MAG: TonB-dependent receptor, partial [Candidatus Symbiothrix sp.]|nr:TonB-dependent receptor [Candidatus Symbiothrix sp.]
MKRTILLAVLFSCILSVFAEGELDAVRLSRSDLKGTARGVAMGGAFGALGGDVTSIGINPAGLGIYRSSEINTSLGFTSANTKTDLQGENASSCR